MTATLGSFLLKALEARGVRHVFGIPGVHNLELYRGMAASRIRHVGARHEQGLGFMADGYARISGRPGVCFTITGPGLTNITTALAQAYGDSIPLLVISSENRTSEIGTGRGFLHETRDQLGIAARVTGFSHRLRTAEELPQVLQQAFNCMTSGRPRPAYIEIPRDLLDTDTSAWSMTEPIAGNTADRSQPLGDAPNLARVAQQLSAATMPVMLVGGGARGAVMQVRQLAEMIGAPMVMTVNARGVLPCHHPLAVPMSASLSAVRELIAAADVALAVGTEFGPTDYDMYSKGDFPPLRNLLRIDIDAEQLQRGPPPTIGIHSAATPAVRSLLTLLAPAKPQPARLLSGENRARDARVRSLSELTVPMRRQIELLECIRDLLPAAIMVGDSTQPVYAGNLGFNAASPGSWFNSATGFGTLGYALPAATGAGLAAPERPVICLTGDGGIQFSLGELAAPRDVDAWLAIIVWNNHGYGEIKTSMQSIGIEPRGVDVRPPEFHHLAKAYGYVHQMIDSLESLRRAIRAFGARRQIVVMEIRAELFE